jgi:hypothetical protein
VDTNRNCANTRKGGDPCERGYHARLLAQHQRPVTLFDARQSLEETLAEQVHFARLGRENESLDIVHIEAIKAQAAQYRWRSGRLAVGGLDLELAPP